MRRGEISKLLGLEAPAWQREALCAQTDPEAFFPDLASQAKAAKRVCASCPVIRDCFKYAIDTEQEFGVWGGVDFTIRRTDKGIRRRSEGAKLA